MPLRNLSTPHVRHCGRRLWFPTKWSPRGRAATLASSYNQLCIYLHRVQSEAQGWQSEGVQRDGGAVVLVTGLGTEQLRERYYCHLHHQQQHPPPPSTQHPSTGCREGNISSLGAAVQHNFRRTLLVPSREENISSLGAAVQHNFRRTLLMPSREENIKRKSIAWAPRYSQVRSLAKIP